MKTKLKEIDMEDMLEKFFHGQNDKNWTISRQVYFGGKKIDMVLIGDGTVSSIEVKISDWKTALRQANLNRLACDYSYVAMWHEDAEKAVDNLDQFIKAKVGLIVLDNKSHPFYFYSPKPKLNERLLELSKSYLMASAVR